MVVVCSSFYKIAFERSAICRCICPGDQGRSFVSTFSLNRTHWARRANDDQLAMHFHTAYRCFRSATVESSFRKGHISDHQITGTYLSQFVATY